MNKRIFLPVILLLGFFLCSCANLSGMQPATLTPEIVPATVTPRPVPTLTVTPTVEAIFPGESLESLMGTNGNCDRPCFWGVTPGQWPQDQLLPQLRALTGWGGSVTQDEEITRFTDIIDVNGDSVGLTWEFIDGNLVSIAANVGNDTKSPPGEEIWPAFQPVEMLKSYGVPGEIRFTFVDMSYSSDDPLFLFAMAFLYPEQSASILFDYFYEDEFSGEFCPGRDVQNISMVQLLLGDDMSKREGSAYPVNTADLISLTAAGFHDAMIHDPENFCFSVPAELIDEGER